MGATESTQDGTGGGAAPPSEFDLDEHSSVPTHYEHAHEWGDEPTIPFFPDHFMSEVTTMFLILCVYSLLCIFFPATLENRANPLVTPVGAKPEWYFLFMYAYLHYVPSMVGLFTPLVGIALLVLLPWLDRNPSRAPKKRLVALVGSFVLLAIILVLTIIGIRT